MMNLNLSGVMLRMDAFEHQIKGQYVRAGSAEAARVLYEEARDRCPVKSGLLKSSIYRVHSTRESRPGRDVYHVSWNYTKAPHGHLIEFGTSRMAARSFLRTAFEAVSDAAITAGIEAMAQAMNK